MHPLRTRQARRRATRLALGLAAVGAITVTSACATTAPSTSTDTADGGHGKVIQVVAAENFWGSIARQLGGDHVKVTSIITNPDTDPHSYEPTAADGRTVAGAQYAIVNGIGYDSWADKLIGANPSKSRSTLDVGDLVGVKQGGNPHQWYSPDSVTKVVEQISADYQRIDPADAAYFQAQQSAFETKTLASYHQLISDIRTKYAGTPIGASESIVSPLAEGLGLKLITPASFLAAMSEGTDPTAADKAAIDQQIAGKQIKVYVYNTQNSTPDVTAQVNAAKAQGIPVATVTETLAPAGAGFQDWQTKELQGIEAALSQAVAK
ncbi:zinc/manganese transport system substrate-binding protein [Kitasatospora sp. MAP12-15]|uniref:metal ABC transporter solute-binding protein, Zn/Mn family n=1 Tax=unclassified Kitasatospora TaxID=2633591 RepID=UPI0024770752|nr:zinc ABC transporter substrate-binding protein [Kitasatospora sp. MAP12-44]MDH6114500.1 zinc/manganese transport system substrate-binding protein [Kitasatospora sp. MAP12-44]